LNRLFNPIRGLAEEDKADIAAEHKMRPQQGNYSSAAKNNQEETSSNVRQGQKEFEVVGSKAGV